MRNAKRKRQAEEGVVLGCGRASNTIHEQQSSSADNHKTQKREGRGGEREKKNEHEKEVGRKRHVSWPANSIQAHSSCCERNLRRHETCPIHFPPCRLSRETPTGTIPARLSLAPLISTRGLCLTTSSGPSTPGRRATTTHFPACTCLRHMAPARAPPPRLAPSLLLAPHAAPLPGAGTCAACHAATFSHLPVPFSVWHGPVETKGHIVERKEQHYRAPPLSLIPIGHLLTMHQCRQRPCVLAHVAKHHGLDIAFIGVWASLHLLTMFVWLATYKDVGRHALDGGHYRHASCRCVPWALGHLVWRLSRIMINDNI